MRMNIFQRTHSRENQGEKEIDFTNINMCVCVCVCVCAKIDKYCVLNQYRIHRSKGHTSASV